MELIIKPLDDHVLVEAVDQDEQQSKGGIVLPKGSIVETQCYRVLATGEGKRNDNGEHIPCNVQAGDIVIPHTKYEGNPIKLDGREYTIFQDIDLLAVVREPHVPVDTAPQPHPDEGL